MAEQIVAIAIFAGVLAFCFIRQLPIGVVTLAAASIVGVYVADLSLKQVLAGFPVSLAVLLIGVTFFFGIAQANGTIDLLVEAALRRVGDRTALLPLVFALLAAGIAGMGNPFAAIVVFPIGMHVAMKRSIDPMLMGLALGIGVSAGSFAPTGLFGLVTYGTAESAGIDLSRSVLFAVAAGLNAILLALAYLLFGRRSGGRTTSAAIKETGSASGQDGGALADAGVDRSVVPAAGGVVVDSRVALVNPMTREQGLTVGAIVLLFGVMVGGSLLGQLPDMGVLGMALGSILCVVYPKLGKEGMARVDWSTTLLVAGIITYVGVLQEIGAIEMLGEQAARLGTPLIVALLICGIAGLVSAFASTTAMLAALVPLAIPLVSSGSLPGWAMICAIGICASVVDISPFSSTGAAIAATTPCEAERPRVTRLLARWGLSMIVIGPVLTIGGLVIPAMAL